MRSSINNHKPSRPIWGKSKSKKNIILTQVGSEINDGTVIDVRSYENMTEVHMDEFRPNISPIKVNTVQSR